MDNINAFKDFFKTVWELIKKMIKDIAGIEVA